MINEEKVRKKVKQLVILSKTGGQLDSRKIALIAKQLKRRELALYYQDLLRVRSEEKVMVTAPMTLSNVYATRLAKAFPKKDIEFYEDPNILGGLKVSFGDFVFDGTLKTFLRLFEREYENN